MKQAFPEQNGPQTERLTCQYHEKSVGAGAELHLNTAQLTLHENV